MADGFLALSPADRRDALEVAAARSGRAVHLLEKDVWVVWTLSVLFESDFADDLVFKGGTSLSKAYQAIGRFSEDVDLTYDIRVIAPDPGTGQRSRDSLDSQLRAAPDEDHSRTLGCVGERDGRPSPDQTLGGAWPVGTSEGGGRHRAAHV